MQATPRAGRKLVDPQHILEQAFTLYAAEGEAGFSVRKVGALAAVDPMTVLHHFKSKETLLRHIADRALADVELPRPSGSWRTDLHAIADAYRALSHRYPRIFHLHFRFHVTGPVDHVASEMVYRSMLDAGLPADQAASQGLAYYSFILGFALAESEGLMKPIDETVEAELLSLDADAFSASRALVPAFKALDPGAAFHVAVDAYITGIAALAAKK